MLMSCTPELLDLVDYIRGVTRRIVPFGCDGLNRCGPEFCDSNRAGIFLEAFAIDGVVKLTRPWTTVGWVRRQGEGEGVTISAGNGAKDRRLQLAVN